MPISNKPETQAVDSSDEAESNSSDVEEFSVKKSVNHKVFKGNNPDAQKRLTRSADLKKTEAKLPVLTKVNIQNVPKGITITKTKKVVANNSKPTTSPKKADTETLVKKTTPNSSPDSKPSGSQKFTVVKAERKELSVKSTTTDNIKRKEVQKVKLTKAQVAAMAKEGKIAVKDGQVFLRNGPNKSQK